NGIQDDDASGERLHHDFLGCGHVGYFCHESGFVRPWNISSKCQRTLAGSQVTKAGNANRIAKMIRSSTMNVVMFRNTFSSSAPCTMLATMKTLTPTCGVIRPSSIILTVSTAYQRPS